MRVPPAPAVAVSVAPRRGARRRGESRFAAARLRTAPASAICGSALPAAAPLNEARIVSVAVPGGLKIGANDVTVKLAKYGVADLQTSHVTLMLPPGTRLGADIEVYGAGYGDDSFFYDELMASMSAPGTRPAGDDRQSVSDLVGSLETAPTNNDILVDYLSGDESSSQSPEGVGAAASHVSGDIVMNADRMTLRAHEPQQVDPVHGDLERRRRQPRRHRDDRRQGEVSTPRPVRPRCPSAPGATARSPWPRGHRRRRARGCVRRAWPRTWPSRPCRAARRAPRRLLGRWRRPR
jgi:hypothetical protein